MLWARYFFDGSEECGSCSGSDSSGSGCSGSECGSCSCVSSRCSRLRETHAPWMCLASHILKNMNAQTVRNGIVLDVVSAWASQVACARALGKFAIHAKDMHGRMYSRFTTMEY